MEPKEQPPIRRVAVLGAGVMGAGIAAHVANAGYQVLLLDIVPPDLKEGEKGSRSARNRIAATSLANLARSRPSALFASAYARLISIGNLEDDLATAGQCDLIIEAIVERLDIKRALYTKLESLVGPGTILASNTSGLRIADLLTGRSGAFRRNFLITHFFNPPRYMKLLEIVAGPDTDAGALARAERFGREVLGKGIVRAKDTPNFIANRIGAHAMMAAIHVMLERKLAPEDIDALTGVAMGHPKSATFRTGDVVGLDTLAHVVDNCYQVLTSDEDREVFALPPFVRAMLEQKRLGDKTRGGFYRKAGPTIETLDPTTGQYRPRGGSEAIAKATKAIGKEPDVRKRVRALVNADGEVGAAAWQILARSLAYSARRVGEISDDVAAIDAAMRWGYNWELGPFETWDALGVRETAARMEKDGIAVAPSIKKMLERGIDRFYDASGRVFDLAAQSYRAMERDPREVTLTVLRRGEAPVLANNGGEAWDIGDGVLCLTYKTKANSIDPDVMKMLHESIARAERDFRALLIANDGDHFSVGANLFLVAMAAGQKEWEQLRQMIALFQGAVQRLKYASVPVVAAPFGMTLGGGLEVVLGCTTAQAAAETYAGLVEVGVGLVPGGGGTMNLLWRALENVPQGVDFDVFPFVAQIFKNIATAQVATSAGEAVELGYLRRSDGVSFDRARQLWEAKRRAIALAESGHHPPLPRAFKLPGESGIATLHLLVNTMMQSGFASEHDGVVARHLARILCGGASGATHEVTEAEILELEREAFVSLCGEPKSQERMQHMLMHNKPLRN
ncbi:MAG TPA: 3-hydroxyacyl-CoA dehydrogenase NAD-binding domain-containing protein [Kofleriaceae bacterium]|nr:3-hydroxyacyl-CoA dehydrogenase NAD-binding domain-containing protein [Kofleriaceae bacterium]